MANKMDRGLDEIIAEHRSDGSRNRRGGGPDRRRRERPEQPRDGVKKSFRDESRNLDREWVHDRYDESNSSRRGPAPRRRRDSPEPDRTGSKIRVDNIHYDLSEEDLDELFKRIGPVTKLQLRYDRAGRSEGTAYVTYEHKDDASEAIRQFDGANANGQPIRLSMVGPSRNPFDSAVMPGRPLSERVSAPGNRSRSLSPTRRYNDDDAARRGIDRYLPGSGSRSRSPMPPRRGGRRPGANREQGGRDRDRDSNKGKGGGNPRSKKTQEELDAEMADYFGGSAEAPAAVPATTEGQGQGQGSAAPPAPVDDIDMIE